MAEIWLFFCLREATEPFSRSYSYFEQDPYENSQLCAVRTILIILWRGWLFFSSETRNRFVPHPKSQQYVCGHDYKYGSTPKRKLSKKLRSDSADNQTRASFLGGKHYFAQYYRHCNFCERIDLVFLLENRNASALTTSRQGKIIFPF